MHPEKDFYLNQQENAIRPRAVKIAVGIQLVLCVSLPIQLLIFFLSNLKQILNPPPNEFSYVGEGFCIALITQMPIICVWALFMWLIWRGHKWARNMFLGLNVIILWWLIKTAIAYHACTTSQGTVVDGSLHFVQDLVYALAPLFALALIQGYSFFLLFRRPGNTWFKAHRKNRSTNTKAS
jgi:hypothetical protein